MPQTKFKASIENMREGLMKLPKETLVDLVVAGGRNCWSVQNNWMEYVYGKYGNEAAGQADEAVFQRFSKSLIHRERRILNIQGDDIPAFLEVFKYFPMQESDDTYITVDDAKVVIQINTCTMGTQRKKTGRPFLPCKPAGLNFFRTIAQMINPAAKVTCVFCPPDEVPADIMCKWEVEFPAPK